MTKIEKRFNSSIFAVYTFKAGFARCFLFVRGTLLEQIRLGQARDREAVDRLVRNMGVIFDLPTYTVAITKPQANQLVLTPETVKTFVINSLTFGGQDRDSDTFKNMVLCVEIIAPSYTLLVEYHSGSIVRNTRVYNSDFARDTMLRAKRVAEGAKLKFAYFVVPESNLPHHWHHDDVLSHIWAEHRAEIVDAKVPEPIESNEESPVRSTKKTIYNDTASNLTFTVTEPDKDEAPSIRLESQVNVLTLCGEQPLAALIIDLQKIQKEHPNL